MKVSPKLLIIHEKDIVAGLRAALARHRDRIHLVLADLDAADATLALGALTSNLSEPEDGAFAAALDRIGGALRPELIGLAQHPDPVVRKHALSVLSKLGSADVVPTLSASLRSASFEHRIVAVEAISPLMRRNGPGAKILLVDVRRLLAAEDWREQVAAATALGRYGAGSDDSALAAVARDQSRKAFVRQAAVTALGNLRLQSSIPALASAARDPARAVQEQAVLALRRLSGPRAAAALRAIASDSRVSTRARALISTAKPRKN